MNHKPSKRLDNVLVERGMVDTRSRAQGLILAGQVRVDGEVVTKAGLAVADSQQVELAGDPNPFVSRGGLKLEAALEAFRLDVSGRVALDIGASTGGFTDCLLQRGASRIYAIDVGYGQLHWTLRQDPRVVLMERTNARNLQPSDIPEPCSLAVLDVSFISLAKVMPAVLRLLSPSADLVALVKPQFEASRADVASGGVIRDPGLRLRIIDEAIARLTALNLTEKARLDSPVPGPKGNIECLVWLRKEEGLDAGKEV